MIIYGDPSYQESLGSLISRLESRVRSVTVAPVKVELLDGLRMLLIEAGELEQAVEDAGGFDEAFLAASRSATNAIAEVLHRVWQQGGNAGGMPVPEEAVKLFESSPAVDCEVRVKVPEGFAFYTLFPEQYIASATAWADAHVDRRGPVLVVGIRSIGTTLSAVVRAALNAAGWRVHRITVRPKGHPFDRRANFNAADLKGVEYAIVVDEGPGASGSSMAAVARGLVEAGFDPSRISFLPGHGGEPGPHASDEVRRWWSTTRRYSVPLADLRWSGRSLKQKLVERTERLLPGAVVERVEDLSGGLWQDVLFSDAEPKPAAFPAFERTKYRCTLRDGRAVLWKFAGLGAEAERIVAQIAARADAGWTSRPLGMAFGFVGLPWIEGRALSRRDLSQPLLEQIGFYIGESAGVPLDTLEESTAFERLREMLYWNAWESLGDRAAQRSRELSNAAAQSIGDQPILSYGDGRLAPHEWIRTSTGSLQKVDCAGHDCDHTVIGRQPLIWDVAGAVIEWGLDETNAARLVDEVAPGVLPDLLRFYCAAYAAFRVGMAAMCGVDTAVFREQLAALLGK